MKIMLKKILIGFVVLASFTGCLKSGNFPDPCDYDPCEFKAPDAEIQNVQTYLTANSIPAIQHCSGLFYVIETQGTGANPQTCSNINVKYEGRLTNGTLFDSNSQGVTFNLSEVINGWRNALPVLKAGGRMHLFVPPSLGYGSSAVGSIPPHSILVFTIDLVAVQ